MVSNAACELGTSAAPVRPCKARNSTICVKLCDTPHKIELTVNPNIEVSRIFLRPTRPVSQPANGVATAAATM